LKNSKKLLVTLLCVFQYVSYAQETKTFTYNGNSGKRNKGTFDVTYYIESDGRSRKLNEEDLEIDLDKYRNTVYFVIEFNKLRLGLNHNFTKVKHKEDRTEFSINLTDASKNDGFAPIVDKNTVRVYQMPEEDEESHKKSKNIYF